MLFRSIEEPSLSLEAHLQHGVRAWVSVRGGDEEPVLAGVLSVQGGGDCDATNLEWRHEGRGKQLCRFNVHDLVLVPYRGILYLEWDSGIAEGVCDFCICTLIPVSGYHGDDL